VPEEDLRNVIKENFLFDFLWIRAGLSNLFGAGAK